MALEAKPAAVFSLVIAPGITAPDPLAFAPGPSAALPAKLPLAFALIPTATLLDELVPASVALLRAPQAMLEPPAVDPPADNPVAPSALPPQMNCATAGPLHDPAATPIASTTIARRVPGKYHIATPALVDGAVARLLNDLAGSRARIPRNIIGG